MAKKRRTELDIDTTPVVEPKVEEPQPEVAPLPTQEEPEEKPKPEPEKRINKAKLAIIASIAFGAFVIIIGVSWGVYSLLDADKEEPKEEVNQPEKARPKTALLPQVRAIITPTYQFHPFFLESKKNKKPVFVQVAFATEMSDKKVSNEITRNLVLIRENIFYFLGKKKIDDFIDPKKKRRMNIDIAIILNRSIQSGAVTKVFITYLVIK